MCSTGSYRIAFRKLGRREQEERAKSSFLSKRSHHLIGKWLDEAGKRRSVSSRKKYFNPHAGNDRFTRDAFHAPGDRYGAEVVCLAGSGIQDSRDTDRLADALEFWRPPF